jgi:GNAT superfamily N-acetyltransferase
MEIIQATDADLDAVRALFWEYLQWANARLQQTFGVSFDIAAMLEADMANIQKFYPPPGRLFLARHDEVIAGCACVQTVSAGIIELKRTFVRPAVRGRGVGRALVQALIDDLTSAGYMTIRLDSANFMQEAHALYRTLGFHPREPYPESEIPPEFHASWVFMERQLRVSST